jgi:multidrug efflux system membrane fusion protein
LIEIVRKVESLLNVLKGILMIYRCTHVSIVTMIIGVLYATPVISYAEPLQGITSPNADITLSFILTGSVSDVLVKAGSTVEKGQPLVQLFNEPERIQSEQLRMLSEDQTKIHAAEADLAQKQADLGNLKQANAKGAASQWEVDHSTLNVRIAELAVKSALVEQEQYRRRYEHTLSQLKRMRLEAPITGRAEEVSVEAGESIGPLGPVVRVVQNDPLWVDVHVPISKTLDLSVGQSVWVEFTGDSEVNASPNGRIVDISTVADAASETLRIRIEAPNPNQRPAGERVTVFFSPEEKNNLKAVESEP